MEIEGGVPGGDERGKLKVTLKGKIEERIRRVLDSLRELEARPESEGVVRKRGQLSRGTPPRTKSAPRLRGRGELWTVVLCGLLKISLKGRKLLRMPQQRQGA